MYKLHSAIAVLQVRMQLLLQRIQKEINTRSHSEMSWGKKKKPSVSVLSFGTDMYVSLFFSHHEPEIILMISC